MPVVTAEELRSLAAFHSPDVPVLSCYLDVDGRRWPRLGDLVAQVEGVLRRVRANGSPSVQADAARVVDTVKELDRSRVRGLAVFACSAHELWKVYELPVGVTTQAALRPSPSVRQLEWLLAETDRVGFLLVDRQRARLLVFELGEVVERSELFDALARGVDDGRDRAWTPRDGHGPDAATLAHLRHAADAAFLSHRTHGVGYLVLGVGPEVAHELEACLHPWLRARVVERRAIPTTVSAESLRSVALEVEAAVVRQRDAAVVQQWRDAVGTRGRAVAGLGAVMAAVAERRVATLLVSRGFTAEGWRCPSCGATAQVGPSCGACGASLVRVDDLVDEVIDDAVAAGAVVHVCDAAADLDVAGGIGALLRY